MYLNLLQKFTGYPAWQSILTVHLWLMQFVVERVCQRISRLVGNSKAWILSLWLQGMLLLSHSHTDPMDSICPSSVSQNTLMVFTRKVQDSAGCIYDIVKSSSLLLILHMVVTSGLDKVTSVPQSMVYQPDFQAGWSTWRAWSTQCKAGFDVTKMEWFNSSVKWKAA